MSVSLFVCLSAGFLIDIFTYTPTCLYSLLYKDTFFFSVFIAFYPPFYLFTILLILSHEDLKLAFYLTVIREHVKKVKIFIKYSRQVEVVLFANNG